jgi:hypothetical protein
MTSLFKRYWPVASAAAVLAGLFLNAALSLSLDAMLRGMQVLPPIGQSMSDTLHILPLSYRILFAAVCFYVTARLAPFRPGLHVLILATIALLLTLATTIATWDAMSAPDPKWFQIAMMVSIFPTAWLAATLAGLHRTPSRAGRDMTKTGVVRM